jgi:hypothetical protein
VSTYINVHKSDLKFRDKLSETVSMYVDARALFSLKGKFYEPVSTYVDVKAHFS